MAGEAPEALVSYHMMQTNSAISEIRDTLTDMSRALSALVRVEQQQVDHAESIRRSWARHDALEIRVAMVEKEIPLLRQTHNWVVAGVIGIVSLVAITGWQIFTDIRFRSTAIPITSVQPKANQ